MGGYGALRIGMKHPDMFGSLYVMSACCLAARGAGPENAENEARLAALRTDEDVAGLPFILRAQLAAAAAWSPRNAWSWPLTSRRSTSSGAAASSSCTMSRAAANAFRARSSKTRSRLAPGVAAVAGGATALNYVEATGLVTAGRAVRGVEARDRLTDQALTFEADTVLNAAGPWSAQVAAAFGQPEEALFRPALAFTLLLDTPPLSDAALVVNAEHGSGGTWTGAVEQLEKLRLVPVFVRANGAANRALEALI
jgi:glycine/D-amino acid oxidase-like deaminating enzyme